METNHRLETTKNNFMVNKVHLSNLFYLFFFYSDRKKKLLSIVDQIPSLKWYEIKEFLKSPFKYLEKRKMKKLVQNLTDEQIAEYRVNFILLSKFLVEYDKIFINRKHLPYSTLMAMDPSLQLSSAL